MDWRASASPSRTCLARSVEVLDGVFSVVVTQELGQYFKLNRNSDITLRQRVVNFAGDAVTLCQDCVEFPFCAQQAQAQEEDNELRRPARPAECRTRWSGRNAAAE